VSFTESYGSLIVADRVKYNHPFYLSTPHFTLAFMVCESPFGVPRGFEPHYKDENLAS
jgi:hypothetical protein